MVEALRAYIITVADEQGAVLVFEDMHWADPSSLELLDTIIAAAHQTRLLVICTCRLEYRATWLDYQQISELERERLSAEESLKFVEQLLVDRQVDTAIKHEIATKTDGGRCLPKSWSAPCSPVSLKTFRGRGRRRLSQTVCKARSWLVSTNFMRQRS